MKRPLPDKEWETVLSCCRDLIPEEALVHKENAVAKRSLVKEGLTKQHA